MSSTPTSMPAQETKPEIKVGDRVKFIEEYKDHWGNPKVEIGTTGEVAVTRESGIYEEGRLDVKLDDGTVIKHIPSPFVEIVASQD